ALTMVASTLSDTGDDRAISRTSLEPQIVPRWARRPVPRSIRVPGFRMMLPWKATVGGSGHPCPGKAHQIDGQRGQRMATVEECRTALEKLIEQFDEISEEDRAKHVVERRLACRILDLDVTFYGRIHP